MNESPTRAANDAADATAPAQSDALAATQPQTTSQWLARIQVTLKPVVLDPQGDAVLTGLHQLGFASVAAVRVGKYLEVTLDAARTEDADAAVRQMCDRLLANPVIESYHFTVERKEMASGA